MPFRKDMKNITKYDGIHIIQTHMNTLHSETGYDHKRENFELVKDIQFLAGLLRWDCMLG